jgi:hypothetical protein
VAAALPSLFTFGFLLFFPFFVFIFCFGDVSKQTFIAFRRLTAAKWRQSGRVAFYCWWRHCGADHQI